MTTVDIAEWIGRTETVTDDLARSQAAAAAALFDEDSLTRPGSDSLPPLWHWFYFLPTAPQSRLSDDGHPERGTFMPPVPLPRRMFAGSRVVFHAPLRLGVPAEREGTIRNVVTKDGKSGRLAFVTVGYRILQDGRLCVEEEQDIVYRDPGLPVAAPTAREFPPPAPDSWTRDVTPDSRMLFRFSALTFNAHRIHYDREYAMRDEGYPGLVVHGPLNAMLLANLVRQHTSRPITAFSFRGIAPVFDLAPFRLSATLAGDEVSCAVIGPEGTVALQATARLGNPAETATDRH
jgi:3-methylfumaryl-CoA hydratase